MPDASEPAAAQGLNPSGLRPVSTVLRWVVVVGVAAVFVVGVAGPGWLGAVALLAVVALLVALTSARWPGIAPAGRMLRCAIVVVLLLVAVSKVRS